MPAPCSVRNCIVTAEQWRSKSVTQKTFPKDPKLRKIWLDAINLKKVKKNAIVCSQHFEENLDYPTLYLDNTPPPTNESRKH